MSRSTAELSPDAQPSSHHAVAALNQAATASTSGGGGKLKAAAQATWRWFRAAPAERFPLLGGGALYGAGALAYAADLPWWGIGMVTVAGSVATYAAALHKLTDWRIVGAPAATAASGAWLATAAEIGPAAGPSGLMTWLYLGGFTAGYALHRLGLRPKPTVDVGDVDDVEPQVVEEQPRRINWEAHFDAWGLSGARVVKTDPTRLGERALLDTRGTGKRASSFVTGHLAELIAETFDLPKARVQVKTGRIAGQLWISIRLKDPWAEPIEHPLLDPDSEIHLPDVSDVREPLIIGQDPETGEPLTLTVWDEDGAAHIMVVAIKGGGKTVFLNNVMERLTAANNTLVCGIDVSKAKDMRRWRASGALGPTACGPKERAKAVRILEWAADLISHRAERNTDAVFQPWPGHPAVVVVIDEVDALVTAGDNLAQRAQVALTTITSKGRSESVGAILVGQRGSAQWLGGGNIRANLDRFAFLKVSRRNEMALAAGELGLELPDMTRYGEGKPGVVLITDVSGNHFKGRTFKLKDLDDVSRIAEGRTPSALEPDVLADPKLGPMYTELMAGNADGATVDEPSAKMGEEFSAQERAAQRERIKASLRLIPTPDPETAAKLREHSRARWQMFTEVEQAAASPVPAAVRSQILSLLEGGEGVAMRDIETELGVSNATAWRYMAQLREEGVVETRGRGAATRWYRTPVEHTA